MEPYLFIAFFNSQNVPKKPFSWWCSRLRICMHYSTATSENHFGYTVFYHIYSHCYVFSIIQHFAAFDRKLNNVCPVLCREVNLLIVTVSPQFTIHRIPRSREVRQSWTSSVVSTLNALLHAVPLMFRLRPDMVGIPSVIPFLPICQSSLSLLPSLLPTTMC